MAAVLRTTAVRSSGWVSAAASSCRVPTTLVSCSIRAERPGSGNCSRSLWLAQTLLSEPLMFNHNRGLWGYTGRAADGEPLTIQSTGMGGPSAAIVCEELIALGATRLVRIGTCGALDPELPLGALLAVERVLPEDGTSAALGAGAPLEPDREMLE